MKNKYVSQMTSQMTHDVNTNKENIERLHLDLLRVEKQFDVLWQHCFNIQTEIAAKPEQQSVKCSECDNYTKDYHVRQNNNGYVIDAICVPCYLEEIEPQD